MKLIKSRYIFLAWLLFISCQKKFLDVPPAGALSDSRLTTATGIDGTLIGAYSVLTGRGYSFYSGSTNWFWGSVLGGDCYKGSNFGDQNQMNEIQSYVTLKTNTSLLSKYRTSYEGIVRANTALSLLSKASGLSDADKKRIKGEARFLRGHYYFDLKKIFNKTPYIDENTGSSIVKNDIDLWPKIVADFQYAYDSLPEKQSDIGRANKWAAGAYLGKAFLFQGKWKEAKDVFDAVIDRGTTAGGVKYNLMLNFADLFHAPTCENNEESVFAIQAVVGTGNPNNANTDFILNYPHGGGPAACCGFAQPSFDLVNSFRTNAKGLPLLDGSYNNADTINAEKALKNDMGFLSKDPFTPDRGNIDPRLDHSVGRRGIPYWNWGDHPGYAWIREQVHGGPYAPKKFVYQKDDEVERGTWNPLTGNNFPIIRFADVLLMAAEAEAELENLEQAREHVNRVRRRAKNWDGFVKKIDKKGILIKEGGKEVPAATYKIDEYPANLWTKDYAIKAIRFERKLELSGEGHRFFDLVRWGVAEQVLNAYIENNLDNNLGIAFRGVKFTPRKSEYQPIPQQEIDIAGADKLKQNNGYD